MVNCTFGKKNDWNVETLNEICNREAKHFRNYKIYRPNFTSAPLTSKFYAAHDNVEQISTEESVRTSQYAQEVTLAKCKGPKIKYLQPVTENQEIGWYSNEPLMPVDRRFYYPRHESDFIKIGAIINIINKKIKKVKNKE